MILTWTIFAFRPLTVFEIAEALVIRSAGSGAAVEVEDLPDAIDDEYINSEIVDVCAALVEVRDVKGHSGLAANTVHLIHGSVREFINLVPEEISYETIQVDAGPNLPVCVFRAHGELAKIRLRYLDSAET